MALLLEPGFFILACLLVRKDAIRALNEVTYIYCKHECPSGKYSTRKIHTKLLPGPQWSVFVVLSREDIDEAISRFFTVIEMANDRFVFT